MHGSLPKPSDRRRRRNATSGVVLLPAAGRQAPVPELSAGAWLDSTRAWWATIWASPMAVMWSQWDVPTLERLAQLRERAAYGESKLDAEIRQLEDRFGLSPKARRHLGWFIEGEDVGAAAAAASGDAPDPGGEASRTVDAESDPRRLKLVGRQGA